MRRKFVLPAPCAEVLELIGQLYAVERACPTGAVGTSEEGLAQLLALRVTACREGSAPIVAAINVWADQQ